MNRSTSDLRKILPVIYNEPVCRTIGPGSQEVVTLTPGTRLGPYEVGNALGAGGMGEVYRARDTRLDRTVAIKVLPPHVAADPDLKRRFEREARTVAALNHPHICTLYDIGQEGGTEFLVMECLEGGTLAQRLEKGALPLDKAMRYAVQIADALETTHRQGIVHRDLKPGNVMLTDAGAKLLDFGIARHTAHDVRPGDATILQSVATATGVRLGSPGYMAPEQILGGSVDERSDLFAFGIVLTEMLTGVHPFAEEARRYDGGHCPGPAGETKWPDEVAHSASREAPCQRAGFSSVVVP